MGIIDGLENTEITDGHIDPAMRQQLADVSLLLAGLFPGMLERRHTMLSREHLIEIGQTLYHQLWKTDGDMVYDMLANRYMQIVMILGHVRPMDPLRRELVSLKNTHTAFLRDGEARYLCTEASTIRPMLFTEGVRA